MVGFGWQESIGLPFLVLMTFGYVAIAIWIRDDANRRGTNGSAWFWAWLLFNITALIIYYMVRPRRPSRYE